MSTTRTGRELKRGRVGESVLRADAGPKVQGRFAYASDLSADGMAVVFISAELEEVSRISDRILVLRDGHCVDEVGNDCSVQRLTELIAGVSAS